MGNNKSRIRKNFVCEWIGPRGGLKSRKFFTKEARDKFAKEQKESGLTVKIKQQTSFEIKVNL